MSRRSKLPFMDGGTVALPRLMLASRQYQALSNRAKVLLLMMHMHWRPNEPIAYGCREAEQALKCSSHTAMRTFGELRTAGFIVLVDESLFSSRTGSRARTWRLTYMPFEGRRPTADWAIEKQVNRCRGGTCNGVEVPPEQRVPVDKSCRGATRATLEALLGVPEVPPEQHTYIYHPPTPSLPELIERMTSKNHLEQVAA